MRVFCDTSALLAFLNPTDRFNSRAVSGYDALCALNAELVTSSYVLCECFALVHRRMGFDAVEALQSKLIPLLEVRWIGPETHHRGMTLFLSRSIRGLSLVDATSFIIMRDDELSTAWAYDGHFESGGFRLLP